MKEWYNIIGCDIVEVGCYMDVIGHDSLLIDEEGTYKDNPTFFQLDGSLFYGNGLITGVNEKGESVSCKTTVKSILSRVRFRDGPKWVEAVKG